MQNIIVLDDEKEIADLLEVYLTNEGYQVFKFYRAEGVLDCIRDNEISLAILDVMLPDIDGFQLCRKIRENWYFPIIMLTAKVEDVDKITGLTVGADDYITKPFKLAVFISRINALIRRSDNFNQADVELSSGGITIQLLKREVYKNNEKIDLTANEYKLLCLLMENSGQVLSPEQILGKLWDCNEDYVDSNTLTVYIRRLRTKIEDNPGKPERIVTVRRMGYKWNSVE